MDASLSPETRFAALIEGHRAILYKVAYVYARDPEERRDLIQDMAMELWRAFGSFSGQSRISTWVYRVTMNVAISHRRREGRRLRHTLPLDLGLEVADRAFDADDPQTRDLGSGHSLPEPESFRRASQAQPRCAPMLLSAASAS
jgi:RNA polymerase sigma factor (sigma-70 family)